MRVYEGRRERVEVFSHILPNGRSIEVERVLFPPVVSVLLVLNCSIVLLRQYQPWGLLGVVEKGEAPEAAAARELEEEAGLKAAWLDLLLRGGGPRLLHQVLLRVPRRGTREGATAAGGARVNRDGEDPAGGGIAEGRPDQRHADGPSPLTVLHGEKFSRA